jgi:hypothetical protein
MWTDLWAKIGRTKLKQIPVCSRGFVVTRQPNENLLLLKPRKQKMLLSVTLHLSSCSHVIQNSLSFLSQHKVLLLGSVLSNSN